MGARLIGRLPPVPVESPCVQLCRIDPASGLCEGCARSLDEIFTRPQL